MRNAHRHRSSDVEKRRSLDRFKKDTRLTYAAADDATKASLHHYTKRTLHPNGTNAKEMNEKVHFEWRQSSSRMKNMQNASN